MLPILKNSPSRGPVDTLLAAVWGCSWGDSPLRPSPSAVVHRQLDRLHPAACIDVAEHSAAVAQVGDPEAVLDAVQHSIRSLHRRATHVRGPAVTGRGTTKLLRVPISYNPLAYTSAHTHPFLHPPPRSQNLAHVPNCVLLSWTSNGAQQGCEGSSWDNGCAAKGTCGLRFSDRGLGGGWELCFA